MRPLVWSASVESCITYKFFISISLQMQFGAESQGSMLSSGAALAPVMLPQEGQMEPMV